MEEETAPSRSSVSSATRHGRTGERLQPTGRKCERGPPPSLVRKGRRCCAKSLLSRGLGLQGRAGRGRGILEERARILSFPSSHSSCACVSFRPLFWGLMRSQVAFGESEQRTDLFTPQTRVA